MRFIRDIIAEKTQAASQDETQALRYPLQLREQDRADVAPRQTPSVNIEAQEPPTPEDPAAQFTAPQPAAAPEDAPAVDMSAISAALRSEPTPERLAADVPDEAAALEPSKAVDPFATLFAEAEDEPEMMSSSSDAAHEDVLPPAEQEEPELSPAAQPEASAPRPAPQEPMFVPSPETAPAAEVPEVDLAALQANMPAPQPTGVRGSKGRVKTRLLGFSAPASQAQDPMSQAREAPASAQAQFPVGWLVVVDGPGLGTSFSLFDGLTQIGRGEGQTVRLDFGDTTISRENHAAIAFDGEQRQFFFGHGGKANLVRLNGRPVLSTEPLDSNSLIRIGETTLRFVALCGADFVWGDAGAGHDNLG